MPQSLKTTTHLSITVEEGNIALKPADAIIATINRDGGGSDLTNQAIRNVTGSVLYRQLRRPLHDGDTQMASWYHRYHPGQFDNVLFVIDDHQRPLADIVFIALKAADTAHFRTVNLPLLRSETNDSERQLVAGIDRFKTEGSRSIEELTVVVPEGYRYHHFLHVLHD